MDCPVHLSFGNIDLRTRSQPLNRASILVALVSIRPKYNFREHGKITDMKEHQLHQQEILRNVFTLIVRPLDLLSIQESLCFVQTMAYANDNIVICT
jgi:hypothetical protein